MSQLSHSDIWQAIDRLAASLNLTPSALARRAGLDPTSFNLSKRGLDRRPRWPSTESVAKILAVADISLGEFAALAHTSPPSPPAGQIPIISLERARLGGLVDADGSATGDLWDRVAFPGAMPGPVFALEVADEAMSPVYRPGDRLLVCPSSEVRRGDRVAARLTDGEVIIGQLGQISGKAIELAPLDPSRGGRQVEQADLAWMGRILWVSQ